MLQNTLGRLAMKALEDSFRCCDASGFTEIRIMQAIVFPVNFMEVKVGRNKIRRIFTLLSCQRRLFRILWTAKKANGSTQNSHLKHTLPPSNYHTLDSLREEFLKKALVPRKVKEKRGIGRPVAKWRDSVTVLMSAL